MLIWIVFAAPLLLLLALLFLHPHFFQDVRYVRHKLKVRRKIAEHFQRNYLILDRFLEVVDLQPHKPFLRFKEETYTYRDADELSSQTARVFLQSGRIKQGDAVALLLGNKPIFLFLWLGLWKIGCSAAFLNSNVRSKSLLHCFSRCGAKTLVTDAGIRVDWLFCLQCSSPFVRSTLADMGALEFKTSEGALQRQHKSQNDLWCALSYRTKCAYVLRNHESDVWCAEDSP